MYRWGNKQSSGILSRFRRPANCGFTGIILLIICGFVLPTAAGFMTVSRLSDTKTIPSATIPSTLPHSPFNLAMIPSLNGKAALTAGAAAPLGYHLNAVRRGTSEVPRIFLSDLPRELPRLSYQAERKILFFSSLLPLVLQVNDFIRADRQHILDLKTKTELGLALHPREIEWLARIAGEYRVNEYHSGKIDFVLLLKRVNIIPPSLALGQAALESGWGTSRFAQTGNALFGQKIWGTSRGMVPLDRKDGETHKIRAFGHLMEAVYGYILNLNRHDAYEGFRNLRASMSADKLPLDSTVLATALTRYSARGTAYTQELVSIIGSNHLQEFDQARLEFSPFQPMHPMTDTRLALR